MTVINNDNENFRSAAEKLKPQAKDSSWNRLETLLENDTLLQENTAYKNKMRWLSGTAACFLLIGISSFLLLKQQVKETPNQFAYSTEMMQVDIEKSNQLYDIDKLSILNDSKLWTNIVEGGPKIQTKK